MGVNRSGRVSGIPTWLKYLMPFMLLILFFILTGCSKATLVPGASSVSPVITPTATGQLTTPVNSVPSRSPSISNGQLIYNTSTSDSGQPITYTGGPGMMMAEELTCATCHGPEGLGGTVNFMMRSYDVPNITWPVLSGPDPDMQHPPYTEETLKRAITDGLDPGGGPLEYPMPRWQLSAQDLNDLAAYIMTLK